MAQNNSNNTEKMAQDNFVGILTLSNPKFVTYMVVSSLLILKMCGLILLTVFYRMKKKTYINQEDSKFGGGTTEPDEDVERVRRAFSNDLETIPVFIIISLLYLWVAVPSWVVHFLYYLFFLVRTGHTFVYAIFVIPQPARAILFITGFIILCYMSFHVLIYAAVVGACAQNGYDKVLILDKITNYMAQNHSNNIEIMAQDNFIGVLTLSNPKFATYMIVSSLLILKMCGLILLTIFYRMKNKVFISEEDTKWGGGSTEPNENVERVRRAFHNDLETIPAFIIISLLYLWVAVPSWVVHCLYYLFLLVRTGHSFVYAIYVIPQPARAILFAIGLTILGYMCFHVLIYAAVIGYGI